MHNKTNPWTIILTIVITAIIVGGVVYYFMNQQVEEPTIESTPEVESTEEAVVTLTEQQSFVEYYETRDDFLNSGMTESPEELGFQEVAKVKIACPENPDGPCGGDLLIVAKNPVDSGKQEFYLAHGGGAGYSYYGPFTDDLSRIVEESKSIESLRELY